MASVTPTIQLSPHNRPNASPCPTQCVASSEGKIPMLTDPIEVKVPASVRANICADYLHPTTHKSCRLYTKEVKLTQLLRGRTIRLR